MREEAEKLVSEFGKHALPVVNKIIALNVYWKDDYFISDKDVNGVKEKDTLSYWIKLKHELSK